MKDQQGPISHVNVFGLNCYVKLIRRMALFEHLKIIMAMPQATDWEVARMDAGRPVKKVFQLIRQEMMMPDNGTIRASATLHTSMCEFRNLLALFLYSATLSNQNTYSPLSQQISFKNYCLFIYSLLFHIVYCLVTFYGLVCVYVLFVFLLKMTSL